MVAFVVAVTVNAIYSSVFDSPLVDRSSQGHLSGVWTLLGVFGGAVLGVVIPSVVMAVYLYVARKSGTAKGHLAISEATEHLRDCEAGSFASDDTKKRRQANDRIRKLAATIEGIPDEVGTDDPATILAARERAAAMYAMQSRVAEMSSDEDKAAIINELETAKRLYDSGQWMKLAAVEVGEPPRLTPGARLAWVALVVLLVAGVFAVVVLIMMDTLPKEAGAISLVLGLSLYFALQQLGVSGETMKQAVEVASKMQGSLTGAAGKDEPKDEAPKAE